VQPIQNLFFLTDTCVPLSIFAVFARTVPQCSFRSVLVALVVICFFPPAADEHHVPNLDVATLCRGSNVDPLILATLVELLPGDGVVVVGVIIDAFLVRIATVVEEDAAACNTVFSPVMDRAFVVGCWACNVAAFCLMR
jgi:hypothetical protein